MAAFSLVLLLSCLLAACLYFLWSRRRFYKVAWQLPGPLGLPFIGVGLHMMNPETFLQYMEAKSKKYGSPFISWMGTNCFLYVKDPETVETIFNSPHCVNKAKLYKFLADAIGDGLFTSNSPRWNKHRRLINPAYSRQVINDFLPIFNAEADVFLQKFSAAGATRQVEIYSLLKKSVLETACQTTMGKKMNFHNDGSATIFAAYDGLTENCVRRMLSPWLYPDFLYRLSPLYKRQCRVVGVLRGFVENLLQREGKTAKRNEDRDNEMDEEGQEDKTGRETGAKGGQECIVKDVGADDDDACGITKSKAIFVEQVRKHVDRGQLTWDDVRDETNVTIAATFETTSTSLYLVCLCLAMHPEYQDKLYDELVQLFPLNEGNNRVSDTDANNKHNDDEHLHQRDDPVIIGGMQVTNEQLERMTYTEMVINEAMRLFAPVPMVLRSATGDIRLRDGTVVPRGTQIGIDIYNMHRSERVWGPRAGHFDPEHFSEASLQTRHPFAFVPFTRGLRMCIGYRYALMLMKVLLAKIFRHFRLHTEARIEDVIVKGTVSLKLREYPLCTVSRR